MTTDMSIFWRLQLQILSSESACKILKAVRRLPKVVLEFI